MAYDDGYYYGQCKIICEAESVAETGTVSITDGTSTWSKGLSGKAAEFTVPGRARYTVSLLRGNDTVYSTVVEAGYGDCIHVMLAPGYGNVTERQFDSQVGDFIFEVNSDGLAGYRKSGADTFHPFKFGDGDCQIFNDTKTITVRGLKARPSLRMITIWNNDANGVTAMVWNPGFTSVQGVVNYQVYSYALSVTYYDDGFSFTVPSNVPSHFVNVAWVY